MESNLRTHACKAGCSRPFVVCCAIMKFSPSTVTFCRTVPCQGAVGSRLCESRTHSRGAQHLRKPEASRYPCPPHARRQASMPSDGSCMQQDCPAEHKGGWPIHVRRMYRASGLRQKHPSTALRKQHARSSSQRTSCDAAAEGL